VSWSPTSPVERFAEALAIVPLVHTPVSTGQHVLAIGAAASPLMEVAARYPSFTDMIGVGPALTFRDKRIRQIDTLTALPDSWKADVIAIAVTGLPEKEVVEAKARATSTSVVVVASDRFSSGAALRNLCRQHWASVVMYREYLPEPSVFALCSAQGLTRTRAVPGWAKHLSESYLPNLFRLAKDEYQFLYQSKGVT